MKIYDWKYILINCDISKQRTVNQRTYIVHRIKQILSDEDYVLKSQSINQCLFKNSAINKINKLCQKTK